MPDRSPQKPSEPSPKVICETAAYVQHTLQLLELSVPSEHLPNVVENFERVRTIAQPVLSFPLPDDLEAAPTFEP